MVVNTVGRRSGRSTFRHGAGQTSPLRTFILRLLLVLLLLLLHVYHGHYDARGGGGTCIGITLINVTCRRIIIFHLQYLIISIQGTRRQSPRQLLAPVTLRRRTGARSQDWLDVIKEY